MSAQARTFKNRWLVTARLTTSAPLIIRTGELEPRENAEDEGSVNLIEVDAFGLPCIPGTSLKGAIRSWLVARAGVSRAETIEKLFGREPRQRPDEDVQQGQGGRLEFHDAFMDRNESPHGWVKETGSTAIDPATGAAERRKLRYTELVPANASFKIIVTGDNIDDHEMTLLAAAFEAFGEGEIGLGADGGSGKGKGRVVGTAFRMMDESGLKTWLADGPFRSWQEHLESDDDCKKTIEAAADLEPAAAWIDLDLVLRFDGPFLVSKELQKSDDDEEGAPDLGPVQEGYGDTYYLPGESLRGALRAQARRIVNTVHPGDGDDEPSMRRLFGPKEESATLHRGALDVGDFEVQASPTGDLPTQEFVAIDRFTGGAAESKKFSARYLDRPTVEGRVRIKLAPRTHRTASGKPDSGFDARKKRRLRAADIGLLALLMRDLAEGDIPFGYGRTKGYGACRVDSAKLTFGGGPTFWRGLAEGDSFRQGAFAEIFEPWRDKITGCVARFREASEIAHDG